MALKDVWSKHSQRLRALTSRPGVRLLLENYASLSAVQVLSYLFPLVITPYLTRTLGPERFGLVSSAASFVGLFLYLTNYGFTITATRQVAVYRQDLNQISRIVGAVLLIKSVFLFLGFGLFLSIIMLVPSLRSESTLYLLMFGTVLGEILYPQWLFQGLERMKLLSILNAIGKALTFILVIILITQPNDYLLYAASLSGVQIILGIASLITVKRIGIQFLFPNFSNIKEQLREGWLPFLTAISISSYTQSRLFIFSFFATNTMLGYYAFADKTAGIVQLFPMSTLLAAVLPRLTFMYSQNPERAWEMFCKFQRITLVYLLVVFPIFALFANEIIYLVSGHTFSESVLSFRVLLIAVFFALANAFRIYYLIAAGQYKTFTFIYALSGLAGVTMMMIIIPKLSYLGMAISAAFTEAFILVLTSWKTRNNLYIPIWRKRQYPHPTS